MLDVGLSRKVDHYPGVPSPSLTHRDAAADPMLGMFDFTTVSHAHPILPNAPVDPTGASNCAALHP
jgi:hypothetical protein